MKNLPVHTEAGYNRYRTVSFYFETSLQEAWEAFGAAWQSGDKKPLLIRLASNCFRSGIDEEDTVKWTLLHLGLQADEAEVRLVIRNQYRIGSGFGLSPCVSPVQHRALRLEEFMKRRYDFRYNTQTDTLEYKEKQSFSFDFKPADRRTVPTLLLNARSEGLEVTPAEIEQYLSSDRVPLYAPVEEYLRRLPLWDGKDRIRPLAASVPCRCPWWTSFFFRWFVRIVAHWLQKDAGHPEVVFPLLTGEGGVGKSAFCRRLLPPELASVFISTDTFTSLGDPQSAFRRYALIHLRGVETAMDGKDMLRFVSSGRYASCIATARSPHLLETPAAVYPFIPLEVVGPIRLLHPLDYEQLYAQALQAVRAGERYWMEPGEEEKFC